ncbi:metallophosphoesterase [Limisalsivibrio acetivorans]|uniref:metallophosphoesterase n=1 Tax=Limisalsivibrio acetivorans TaxID=1304888 RepID=UPI0003B4CCE2|nr:metallophosphoesterase [Limisalsivibrio acetivorans]
MHFALFTFLILFSYVYISLVLFMPYSVLTKAFSGVLIILICLKFIIYEKIGGFFIAPDFPSTLILLMEIMYSTVVIMLFLLVVKDIYLITAWGAKYMGLSNLPAVSPVVRNNVIAGAAFLLALLGTYNSMKVPDVKTVEVKIKNLPAELDGLSIVQLTDIHIGPLLKKDWLEKVVDKTNALEPDIIAVTGDIIDGSPDELAEDIAPLKDLRAKYGVYGVHGNHEYYFDDTVWGPVFEGFGIKMLENEHEVVPVEGTEIVLAGVNDRKASRYNRPAPDIEKALKGSPEVPRILLAHRPEFYSDKVDLQLSGHTHGGHLFFMKPLVGHFNGNLVGGLYRTGDTAQLYLSAGTGIWAGFSCRLGVDSEITRILLRGE